MDQNIRQINLWSAEYQGHRQRHKTGLNTDKDTHSVLRKEIKIPDSVCNRTWAARVGRPGFYQSRGSDGQTPKKLTLKITMRMLQRTNFE